MKELNKTIFYSIITVCITIIILYGIYVITRPQNSSYQMTTDKFTHCIQVAMSESRQVNKPINAMDAKDVCIHVEGVRDNNSKAK